MCLETIEYRINCSVCGKELITTNPEDIAHWSCLIRDFAKALVGN